MPRILGVDIPGNKKTHIALRYIYGIGPHHGDRSLLESRRRSSEEGERPQRRRTRSHCCRY